MIQKYALITVVRDIVRRRDEFSIRDIARTLHMSTSTSKASLDFLLSQNILSKRPVGKSLLFRVKNSFITKQIKILCSLSEINSSGIIEEIIEKNKDILSIVVYGSVARGEDDENSDIDILILSRKKKVLPILQKEKLLKRELTILKYTYTEWKEKAEKDKVFYDAVVMDGISLFGEKPVVV